MAEVRVLDAAAAHACLGRPEIVFVDVRDSADWRRAHVPGACNAPRGMLEFYIDPESGFHMPVFDANVQREYLFVCGSGARAALAAQLAKDMGLRAACMAGGIRAWLDAALPVESDPDTTPTQGDTV